MAKAAVTRSIRDDHQKNFLKIFNGLTGKHSRWEIWEDFVTLTAIEISNSTDKVNATERTKMYQTIISKYSAKERDGTHKIFREYGPDEKKWSECDYCKAAHPNCDKCCKACDEPCNAVQDCKKNEERTENDE